MAISLNGTNQALVTASGDVVRNVGSASLTAWIKINSLPSAGQYYCFYQVETNPGNGSRISILVNSSGQIELRGRAPDATSYTTELSTPTISAGSWIHLAGVIKYSGTPDGSIYINGAAVATTGSFGFVNPLTDNTVSLRSSVGAIDGSTLYFVNGQMEDLRCYNRNLSADEVATIYAARGKDHIVYGLNARYKLFGPSAGTVTTELDVSDYKLNGTPQNSPTWAESPLSIKGD
jgi:hypothetical protein